MNIFSCNHHDLVYVLDFLLQISIKGQEFKDSRDIDLDFYNLLNRANINQDLLHVGLLPVSREKKKMDSEFADFISKLSMYIEYDVFGDFVWAALKGDLSAITEADRKILGMKNEILNYMLKKEVISQDDHDNFSVNIN